MLSTKIEGRWSKEDFIERGAFPLSIGIGALAVRQGTEEDHSMEEQLTWGRTDGSLGKTAYIQNRLGGLSYPALHNDRRPATWASRIYFSVRGEMAAERIAMTCHHKQMQFRVPAKSCWKIRVTLYWR